MIRNQRHSAIWLLWDGDCDLCGSWANWLEQLDIDVVLTLISYHDAPPMTPALRVRAIQDC